VGQGGVDTIVGSNGVDFLLGSGADDKLTGLGGADQLEGGNGNDTFLYTAIADSAAGNADVIFDFDAGKDFIDFKAIAGITGDGVGTFTDGTVAAHGISWFDNGTNTFVYADATGDGVADIRIELLGTNLGLTASEFLHV
jgi:serralysin